jgi:DNA mismatch repair ATPase MutS
LVNLHLILKQPKVTAVPNDAHFDDEGRIAILTGPNSGGKTTYLQAVGLAHVLFQAGLPIPSRYAQLSPVDAIFTHFPALETQQQGRLAEEASRLRHICLHATAYSLVLMNESLSSTVASEATYLAQDVLCGLRAIGVRALYATHLMDLPERIPEMHETVKGESALFSLVAGIRLNAEGEAQPTFRIERGAPHGRGYAREIARRHGISLEQILAARADSQASAPKSAAD